MLRLVKNEWQKIKVPVLLALTVTSVAAVVLSCTLYKNYSLFYDLEAWEVGTGVLNFIFPLLVTLPICWLGYYERKNGFLLYTMPRVSKKAYILAKWLAAAGAAFCIVFIPYFLSAVFALYVKPPITPWTGTFEHVYQTLFTTKPLLYAAILSLIKAVIGVLVMSLGVVFSLYVANVFIILTAPFIYTVLENLFWAVLGKPEYRLITAFEPNSLVAERITIAAHVTGPLLLCVFILAMWLFFSKIQKETVYKI